MAAEGLEKCRVRRVLIDIGATKNILYYMCLREMGMDDTRLKPNNMVLEGFTAHKIGVRGTLRVKVTLGFEACSREEEVKFYVVDVDSPYNDILGTLAHSAFELIILTLHQQVRFATRNRIGLVKSIPKSLLAHLVKSQK